MMTDHSDQCIISGADVQHVGAIKAVTNDEADLYLGPRPDVAMSNDQLVRMECLRLAMASYDPINGRAAEAERIVEAAKILSGFVLGRSDA